MNEQVFEKFQELQTDRLQLVRHELEHAPDMYELRIDEDVVQFLDTHPPKSIADIEAKTNENRSNFDDKKGIT
ncbi:MAG: hypothetical protein ACI86M_003685 [Saprospiraceae bacterium]|jgi:hypothetical protein